METTKPRTQAARSMLTAFRTRRSTSRSGFTLVEVLLVLVVLTLIAGIAFPGMQRSMKRSRLRRSADFVRGEWGSARLEAMSSGRIIAFYYEPGSSRFRIAPLYYDPELESLEGLTPLEDSAGRELQGREVLGDLPQGVTFHEEATSFVDERIELAMNSERVNNNADGAWTQPILFYPDGSTTDAYLTIVNDEDPDNPVGVVLSLRGVTGSARATSVVRVSELSL